MLDNKKSPDTQETSLKLKGGVFLLSEQRHAMILDLLNQRHSITVTELTELLDISESTARRDITQLDKEGRLTKVFGGAISSDSLYLSQEPTVAQKKDLNKEEKIRIARYAASLIRPHDFVYLDAGTSTGYMLEHIQEKDATFVTNAVAHAQKLAAKGFHVILLGGTLKQSTEAIIGTSASLMLNDYHFSIGFFGANGVCKEAGYTTPDTEEALVKKSAALQCHKFYALCDHSKFNVVSSVTFAPFARGILLTDSCPEDYKGAKNIRIC